MAPAKRSSNIVNIHGRVGDNIKMGYTKNTTTTNNNNYYNDDDDDDDKETNITPHYQPP